MVISVDPHKAKIAAALWSGAKLVGVRLYYGHIDLLRHIILQHAMEFEVCIVESMVAYPNERIKDPNDLIAVSKVVGLCHLLANRVVEVEARQWKGQTPKKIHHKRIKNVLTEDELAILGKDTEQPDILDAVGIGLKYFRRM